MRTDRLITLVVVVVLLGALVIASGPNRPAPAPTNTAQTETGNDFWPSPGELTVAAAVRLAWLAFWVVVAWRAMRALESIASSLRRTAPAARGPNDTEDGRAG